ncbi:MAG: NAD(+)/NADH kinase [Monoglobus pectinilyticus]|uniref:NAD(+)/NADH kinase n=1 Tax=Monoglobus pectinilyticus TaxID=1981510 RepID=UPI00300EEC95
MKKISIVPNTLKDENYLETKNLIKYLSLYECKIFFEDIHKSDLYDFCKNIGINCSFVPRNILFSEANFLIALGGDGTIIEIAVDAAKYEIPIVGINVGTLGFLTQTDKGDYSAIKDVIDNNYGLTECMMLDISIISKDNQEICNFLALNNLIVTGNSYKMITTSTSVDGTNMGRYSADGLIVSTAIGSTAYSLSAGGAVMHPEVDAMIITPICPHTLKARSTVIPGNSTIEITQIPPFRTEAVARADGKIIYKFKDSSEKIRIKKSKYTTLLVKQEHTNFFDVLRNKLSD